MQVGGRLLSHRLDQTRSLWEVIMMGMNDLRFYTAPLKAAGATGDWPRDRPRPTQRTVKGGGARTPRTTTVGATTRLLKPG